MAEHLPNMHKATLGFSAGGTEIQDHPWLHIKSEASLGYTRSYFKKITLNLKISLKQNKTLNPIAS